MAQLKDLLVNGSARVIGNLFANLNGNVLNFGVCSTAAATAAKTVTTNGTFELITGSKILVLFSETDSSNAPTLNVNGTGAKSIKINASDGIGKGFLTAQQYYWFIYDGTNWRTAGAGITQIIPTQYGGTGNSSFTANRIIYSNTATKLASGSITTDGGYLGNISYLTINEAHQTSYRFLVNGASYFKDNIQIESGKAILFKGSAGGTATGTPTALTYGRLQACGTLAINANTDNSGTEYVILTAGHGMSNSISDGFYVGTNEVGSYLTTHLRAHVGVNGVASSDYALYVNGTSYFNGNTTFNGHILPNTTNSHNLGSSNLRWSTIYGHTINANLPNAAAYPVGKSDKPYHEVARFVQTTVNKQINTKAVFLITDFYGTEISGILEVSARGEANATSLGWLRNQWLIARNVTLENFIATWQYDASNKNIIIKLYVKDTGWHAFNVTKLIEHDWGSATLQWELHNAIYNNAYTLAEIPSNETQVNSSLSALSSNLAKKLTIQANGIQKGQFNNSADVTVNLGNVAQDFTGANSGNAANINADTFAGMTRQQWLNTIYPIGSIYMSVSATSPATLFGGTWESLGGRFLIGQNGTYTAGSTGGEASHTLTLAEAPAHTHTRGTMNITGGYKTGWNDASGGGIISSSWSGAMYGSRDGTAFYYDNPISSTNDSHRNYINFDASRSWTGETDSKGGGGAHNNMPPYLAVYMWKRIA